MQVRHLSLTHFRNFGRLELSLPPGPVLLHGRNAQGKTNLLEALYYLATTRSPFTSQDQEIIQWEADDPEMPQVVGRAVAEIVGAAGARHVELRLIKERTGGQTTFRREALVNQRKVRLMDLLGTLRVVLFLPEDIQLITGSPAQRRRFLDVTICQVDRDYCRTLSGYNRVLEQRNALLRQIAESGSGRDVLSVFTEKLVHLGSIIFAKRAFHVQELALEAQRIHYEQLTDGQESLRLAYLPRLVRNAAIARNEESVTIFQDIAAYLHQSDTERIATRFEEALLSLEANEASVVSTALGPHRDDWALWLNGHALAQYGSRGQQRTAMLGLKLAEINWMRAQTDDEPLLLLDEVVAELDDQRRALLLDSIGQAKQAIVTATDPGMFTADFLEKALKLDVTGGRIVESPPFPDPGPHE